MLDTGRRCATLVGTGEIDTVLVAITDMQGRLQGKRCAARYFLEEVVPHGTEGCNYLMAVDVDMDTVDGYEMSSWESGYGDLLMQPGPQHAAADPLVRRHRAGDVRRAAALDGSPVAASPRQILRAQLDRLAEHGWDAYVGHRAGVHRSSTTPTRTRWSQGYRDLEASQPVQHRLLAAGHRPGGTAAARHPQRMEGAGLYVESAKGECNLGPARDRRSATTDALATCDNHSIYKTGAKEIAAQARQRAYVHGQVRRARGQLLPHPPQPALEGRRGRLRGDGEHGFSELMEHFLAGQVAAPRSSPTSSPPTSTPTSASCRAASRRPPIAWGLDNRTCALRVVGHGESLRVENRVPGGDVEPLPGRRRSHRRRPDGIEEELPLDAAFDGQRLHLATDRRCRRPCAVPRRSCSPPPALARQAFGDDVVDHYLNAAAVELKAFDAAVTDWERVRGFERL